MASLQLLNECIETGNVEGLRCIENLNAIINHSLDGKSTALELAIKHQDVEMAKALIGLGAAFSCSEDLLLLAIPQFPGPISEAMVMYLLSLPRKAPFGSRIHARKPFLALRRGRLQISDETMCSVLLASSIDTIFKVGEGGETMIWFLKADAEYFSTIKAMVSAGFPVSIEMIQIAVKAKKARVLRVLLEAVDTSFSMSIIDIFQGDERCVQLLICHGINLHDMTLGLFAGKKWYHALRDVLRRIDFSRLFNGSFYHNNFPTTEEIKFLIRSYHQKIPPKTYSPRIQHVMLDHPLSIEVAHDLILWGNSPFDIAPSPQTDLIIRLAKKPWSTRNHCFLFSQEFQQHIKNIVNVRMVLMRDESRYDQLPYLPLEVWFIIMSFTDRLWQVDFPELPRPRTFSDSRPMKIWRSLNRVE